MRKGASTSLVGSGIFSSKVSISFLMAGAPYSLSTPSRACLADPKHIFIWCDQISSRIREKRFYLWQMWPCPCRSRSSRWARPSRVRRVQAYPHQRYQPAIIKILGLEKRPGLILDMCKFQTLLMKTTKSLTPTCFESKRCSRVWGIGPSSAATNKIAPSIWEVPQKINYHLNRENRPLQFGCLFPCCFQPEIIFLM